MKERIYVVNTDPRRLVRAASAKQAVKHCMPEPPKLEAEIPTMEAYGVLLLAGVKVEEVERE